MRAVTDGPTPPFIVRVRDGEMYLTIEQPERARGSISFVGWRVEHSPREIGRPAEGYRLLETEPRWRQLDGRRVMVEMPPRHLRLPREVQAAVDGLPS